MTVALITVFILAYAAIAFEEKLRINKAAAGLIGAGLLWIIYAMSVGNPELVDEQLHHSLIETAQIAFFLMGAMTVVEVIDSHDGFEVITSRIRAKSLTSFVWLIGLVTFFLSAVLDNLTTAIVMVSLGRKLLKDNDAFLLLAGIIVIAANAGGAWSPIGDVTTTMLWIGGQVTTVPIVTRVFLPALVNLAVPLAFVGYSLRGRRFAMPASLDESRNRYTTKFERNLMFFMGLAVLVSVPVFKSVTQLPPFLGILFGLGILWAVGDCVVLPRKQGDARRHVTIANALMRIDLPAVIFFVGILLAVATLQHAGILAALAAWLDQTFGRLDVIVMVIGLVSAVIDNVPMVAAAMGMYSLEAHPTDSFLWVFLAYSAGTGGSILIIGSAAGVAAMGLAKIEFFWYVRKFSLLALIGYFAGGLTYIGQFALLH